MVMGLQMFKRYAISFSYRLKMRVKLKEKFVEESKGMY